METLLAVKTTDTDADTIIVQCEGFDVSHQKNYPLFIISLIVTITFFLLIKRMHVTFHNLQVLPILLISSLITLPILIPI